MTATAITFFTIGAIVLWGGIIVTTTIAVRGERKTKKNN